MNGSAPGVLIGFADALAAPEVACSLLGAGHRVVAFARRGRASTLQRIAGVSLVPVTAPEENLASCVAEVASLAAGAGATLPLDDPALLICDRALGPDALLAGPRGEQLRLALDKRRQFHAASAAGLPVPGWVELDGRAPLPGPFSLPAMLKPALAAEDRGGRLRRLSPRMVRTESQLAATLSAWGDSTPTLLQTVVHGTGAGVFGLADEDGIHHLSAHRRIRMMNPAGSGSSACASAPVPSELLPAIGAFLERAGWRGMFMIELLHAGGAWWFMELNGRPWGSLALSRRLGYEYPAWALARALDSSSPLPAAPAFSELTCRHLGRELVHLLFVLRGPGDHAGPWPRRAATIRDLLRGAPNAAWYNRAPEMPNVFLYDAWRTVAEQTWGKLR